MDTNTSEHKGKKMKYWKDQEPPQPGKLFTDPIFPPNINSLLGLDSTGKPIDPKAYKDNMEEVKKFQNLTFARPNEVFGNQYKLFSGKIEASDIIQGQLGDCYFLTALSNLSKYPGLILKIFRTDKVNKDGYYELLLRIDGKPTILIIDDYIPVYKNNKQPCFAKPHGNELWVILLEKAWAKINGGYINTISGMVHEPFEVLTGFSSRVYSLNNLTDNLQNEIIEEMKNAEQSNCFISCATKNDPEIQKLGLVDGHAYSILGINVIETIYKDKYTLLRLRNPWSYKEWIGEWSDDSIYWDEKNKSQVDYKKSNDGIFYMSYIDFFKYFSSLQICYMLYDSTSLRYTVEGEDNLKNGIVFNLEVENDGLLFVAVMRKSWRAHREIRDKALPTHISIVRYNKNPENKLKTFYDYDGTTKSIETCTINKKVTKGNYLIYIYRDTDHAEFKVEPKMEIKIACSANFKHAQMNYDLREDGFPLLQNIIFQSILEEKKYDFNSGGEYYSFGGSFKNNGLGYIVSYGTIPDTFYEFNGNNNNLTNMFLISPYIPSNGTKLKNVFPSGKFIAILALRINEYKIIKFDMDQKIYKRNNNVKLNYQDTDINLDLYTDINNDIKNGTFRKRKTQSLENVTVDINFDITYEELPELEKEYSAGFKLLKEIPNSDEENLKWGIIKINNSKIQNYVYIGQIRDEKKEGKGIFIDSSNIFVGQFKNNLKNGIGIIYNKQLVKLNKFNYINGIQENKGIIYYNNGTYEGDWINNSKHGKGTIIFNVGDKYEGDFKKNSIEGKGIYYYKNGDKYEGDWKSNLKDGKGIYYSKIGNKYVGEFKNDKKEGKGICYYNNGNRYEGEWKNDKYEGKGIFYFKNGDKYDGEFKNYAKEGKGIFYYNTGDRYEGDWKKNNKDGQGVYYYKNGDREMGNYSEDKKVGIHALLLANGKILAKNYSA